MSNDDLAIRTLLDTWMAATAQGDLDLLLSLLADDVVFLTPGAAPMRKDAFAAATRGAAGKIDIEAHSVIQELKITGDWAYCWAHLDVKVTPRHAGTPVRRAGHVLTILRKEPNGQWVIARDANLLSTAQPTAGSADA